MKNSNLKSKSQIYQMKNKSSYYAIDQSGKVEHTSKATVVCLANSKCLTVKISAVQKQRLIATMKELEYPKHFYIYKIFATFIFILLKKEGIKRVIIDKEYPGHESVIKDTLIYLFAKNNLDLPEIEFGLIGKKVQAHIKGLRTYQAREKPTIIATAKNILELLYERYKKGWRSRSSRDNP